MPTKLIRNGAVVDDPWTFIGSDAIDQALPDGPIIVPLALWQQQAAALADRPQLGVWLDSDQSPAALAADLDRFAVIAINFPGFADGRGFSYARELRQTHGFNGEVRAVGAFMRDQLFFLARCGFNAFALDSDKLQEALDSLGDFSETYQAAIDQPDPLFRRR